MVYGVSVCMQIPFFSNRTEKRVCRSVSVCDVDLLLLDKEV